MKTIPNIDNLVSDVDRVLEELVAAGSDSNVEEYSSNFLDRSSLVLGAEFAAIWHFGLNDSLIVSHQTGSIPSSFKPTTEFENVIIEAIQKNNVRFFCNRRKSTSILVCPVENVLPQAAIVFLFCHVLEEVEAEIYRNVARALSEVLDDFVAGKVVSQRKQIEANFALFIDFAKTASAFLDSRKCGFTSANRLREISAADRVVVLQHSFNGCAALASSGAQRVNRRSASIKEIERVTRKAFRKSKKPLVHHSGTCLLYTSPSPRD